MSPNDLNVNEQADHDRSVHDYPHLDLDDDEYVVIDVERSKIGVVFIWVVVLLIFILVPGAFFLAMNMSPLPDHIKTGLSLILVLFAIIILLSGVIARNIYRANYFIVSNKRVFAKVQHVPFVYRLQMVELEHVEDVSMARTSLLQIIFNYGSIRLSTVGDEHTYKFTFSADPESQIKIIQKVVQAVDEGEPTKYRR